MSIFLATLGDPIWQIGGGIILLAALVLLLALRSPEVHLSPWHHWLWTRILLLVCFSLFLVFSAGVVLFHGATATSSVVPAGSPPASAASPHDGLSPTPTSFLSPTSLPSPSPTPTPFPRLTPGPGQVLTTFCDAITQRDLNTAWAQYAQALQKERVVPPPPSLRITIIHCRVDQVSDTEATGLLLLKTIGPYTYTDDYERAFQFTLSVEKGAWKIAQIARCLADGCLPDTANIVP